MNVLGLIVVFLICDGCFSYQIKEAPFPKEKPSWLKVCKRTDPDLNKCMQDLFQSMFAPLAVGIPELKIDPFEPLLLDKVSITKGSGPITLTGSLSNMVVHGASNSTTTFTEFDLKKKVYNFGLELPALDIMSQYNLKGHILVLPLLGHGNCEIKLLNVRSKVNSDIKLVNKNGKEIVVVENMKVKFTVDHMKTKFYNLFNGNKVLGDTVNNFINKNAIEILAELEDSIGESLALIFTDLLNNIFGKLPTEFWLMTDKEFDVYLNKLRDEITAKILSLKTDSS